MQKIAIVTDSTCELDDNYLAEHNINLLPLRILFSDGEFLDRINITVQEFYEKLKQEIPKTSLPSLDEALKLIERLRGEGFTHILALHLSSGLSGTYNMMNNISKEFKDICVEAVDSKILSMGLGFIVMDAVKSLQKSWDFQKTLEHIKEKVEDIKGYFVLPSLEYLRKGGRIGYVAGTIGDLMQIKPIISVNEEGKYFTFDKVRGRKQSLKRLFEIVQEKTEEKFAEVAIVHAEAEAEGRELLEKIKALPFVKNTFFSTACPGIGVHTGPGLVAVIINYIRD